MSSFSRVIFVCFTKDLRQVSDVLGLPTVPVVRNITQLPDTLDKAVVLADGKSMLNRKVDREGLVWIHGTAVDRVSIKTISQKYLLKEK